MGPTLTDGPRPSSPAPMVRTVKSVGPLLSPATLCGDDSRSEVAKEIPDVGDEKVRRFHGREVPTFREVRKVGDLALSVHQTAHDGVGIEDRPPLRRVG